MDDDLTHYMRATSELRAERDAALEEARRAFEQIEKLLPGGEVNHSDIAWICQRARSALVPGGLKIERARLSLAEALNERDAALEEARRYREALETISADNPPLSTDSTSMAHSPDHNILVEALAEIGDFARSALVQERS